MAAPCKDDWHISVSSFRLQDSTLLGVGSLHGMGAIPTKAELQAYDPAGRVLLSLPLMLGERSSGPSIETSLSFTIYGRLPSSAELPCEYVIRLHWTDTYHLEIAMPTPRNISNSRGVSRIFGLPWRHYATRGWRLVRHGQWILFFTKLLQILRATVFPGMPVKKLIAWAAQGGRPLTLVLDHELGGGANHFRERLVSRLNDAGVVPLVLTMHHGVLTYQLACQREKRIRHAYPRGVDEIFSALAGHAIHEVYFNNILSFPRPIEMVVALSGWLSGTPGKPAFTFFVHDYYCICPSWLLLDHEGRYCGIPDQSVCARCLPANHSRFISFAMGSDIAAWRAAWSKLLSLADNIHCFSESSRTLLQRAFPHLGDWNVTVAPHNLSHLDLRKVSLPDPGWPVIGILGHISRHKGSHVVRQLADHILATGSRARLVVIGTIDEELPSSIAHITGPYRPSEIPEIVERHGVNLALFPSICPETFSFVVAELIEMGMPLLCFNLGAPAERVTSYERGVVIESTCPDSVLRGLEQLYLQHVKQTQVDA